MSPLPTCKDQPFLDSDEQVPQAGEQPIVRGGDGPGLTEAVLADGTLGAWALGEAVGLWLCGTPRVGFERRRERQ